MADPGRLRELLLPGRTIWLRASENPNRKTAWTAVLVEAPNGQGLVSLDTTLPNRLVGRALRSGALEELSGWALARTEFPLDRSRFDFLLTRGGGEHLVLEVKSVSLVKDGVGLFPDAITERGARHVRELAEIAARQGWQAGVLFVLQRSGAHRIRAAGRIDERFARALQDAGRAGVHVFGRRCEVLEDRVNLGSRIEVEVG